MTFLAPGFLVATALAVLGALALHFIAWRRATDYLLPTARFLPDEPARHSARAARPADIGLLLLRIAVLSCVGLALARPVVSPRRAGIARLFVLDQSRAVADRREGRDSVRALMTSGIENVFVAFDSSVSVSRQAPSGADSVAPTIPARGSLSAAFVAALREGQRLRRVHRRVELVVVSPFLREELDQATLALRDLWPDSIRLVRVRGAVERQPVGSLEVVASGDDPVAAGVRLASAHGAVPSLGPVRVVRRVLTASDREWSESTGGVLVHWPPSQPDAGGLTPASSARSLPGAAQGVLAGDVTLIGHLIRVPLDPEGTVVARWLDGSIAATETALGAGCLRRVGFDVPTAGDLTLTPTFQRLVGVLLGPCGGERSLVPAPDSIVVRLGEVAAPGAGTSSASSAGPAPAEPAGGRLGSWLIALGLALSVVELIARRRPRRIGDDATRGSQGLVTP